MIWRTGESGRSAQSSWDKMRESSVRSMDTVIPGNTDDDAGVEFAIEIEDGVVLASAYTADDFTIFPVA